MGCCSRLITYVFISAASFHAVCSCQTLSAGVNPQHHPSDFISHGNQRKRRREGTTTEERDDTGGADRGGSVITSVIMQGTGFWGKGWVCGACHRWRQRWAASTLIPHWWELLIGARNGSLGLGMSALSRHAAHDTNSTRS